MTTPPYQVRKLRLQVVWESGAHGMREPNTDAAVPTVLLIRVAKEKRGSKRLRKLPRVTWLTHVRSTIPHSFKPSVVQSHGGLCGMKHLLCARTGLWAPR